MGLLLFAAGWGANHFTTLLIVYRKSLGLAPSALGILFGVYALGLVPGLILAGRASDRWGRRALTLRASVIALLASGLLAFGARGFGILLVGRFLYGLGMGAVMSPGSVWIQELSPPGRGARRATLALSAGFGFGPLVSGLIAQFAPAPMVTPYVVHLLVLGIALFRVRSVSETAPRLSAHAGPVAAPVSQAGVPPSDLTVLIELLPAAPWAFGFAAVTMVVLPGLMRPLVAYPVLYSGLVILTTLSVGVSVQPFVARIGRSADLVGLLTGALGIFVGSRAAALSSPGLVFVAAGLAGAGYGLVMTSGLVEVAGRVAGHARGTAVGVYYVLTYVGFSLPFVHAVVSRHVGDVATLALMALTAVGCLLARAAVKRRRRPAGA